MRGGARRQAGIGVSATLRGGTRVVYARGIGEGLMDLHTEYLGLELPHPIVVGASPLADDIDTARRLEDAGAAALVMRSLFAEQIVRANLNAYLHEDDVLASLAARSASTTFLLPSRAFVVSPDDYLEKLAALKGALDIPVIASLNGAGPGQWLEYAALLEAVG